ncbi:MAG: hypothetical protein QOH32_1612 [Bradyrhizobium sp.]|nr:hypothetical protein [Bradyrhizobium sp.]
MNRIWKAFIIVLATIYFVADALFATVAHPLSRWLGRQRLWSRLRTWIRSLRPYPSLALFAVPVIILEPVKPVAAYLAVTGHIMGSATVLVIGEILKLVLVERLFSLNRDKLLTIPAFAWAYRKYRLARDWLESLEAWQMVRRWSRMARLAIRGALSQPKTSARVTMAR